MGKKTGKKRFKILKKKKGLPRYTKDIVRRIHEVRTLLKGRKFYLQIQGDLQVGGGHCGKAGGSQKMAATQDQTSMSDF